MSDNLDLVRSIYADWERGDFGSVEWADPGVEFVIADRPSLDRAGGLKDGWRDFLSAWEEYRAAVEEYRELRQRHNARLAALSRTLEGAQTEALNLERRHHELERVRRVVASRLQKLEKSQKSTGASLADLHEREAALERLIATLSSRERLTGSDDIRRFRGALPWPVAGPVVQGFGRHYLSKYATYTVCNGLRFSAPSNVPVNAIFPGMVAYARHFKGYGNMVVLDHGNGVYSLVAGLATIHVRLDQRVKMGTRLGLTSPPADNGNIYLEFRVGEKPEDPRRWLQLKGGSS